MTRKELRALALCRECDGPVHESTGRCEACGKLRTFDIGPCECNRRLLYQSVRIVDGPLVGLTGIVHEVNQNDQVATVLLTSADGELLPPLPFYFWQLKPSLLYLRDRLCCVAAYPIAFAIAFKFGWNSWILWSFVAAVSLVAFLRYLQLGRRGRTIKTCPACNGPLESDTSYSTCTMCNWVRPMPPAGREHLEKFFPTIQAADSAG